MYYFDWAATSPISKESLNEYCLISQNYFGNPSSSHLYGINASEKLAECRSEIADMLNTKTERIYFTSGGTESNAIILNFLLSFHKSGEIIISGIEHPAITEYKNIFAAKGWKFTVINCPRGYFDLDKFKSALNPNVKAVCLMAVNNVTGTIQPISEAVNIVREYSVATNKKIHFHCDAVQAGGKIDFQPDLLDVDSAAFSAHKFFGPKGIGILFNKNQSVLPISKGGGQEKGLRAGTENLPAISSMTHALKSELSNLPTNLYIVERMRNQIEEELTQNGFDLISPSEKSPLPYIPNILCVSANGVPSEVFLRVMSDKGFALSATSACSSNTKAKAESVLSAMNISPNQRMSAIRISISHCNSQEEVDLLIQAMIETKKELSHGK